MAALRPRDPRGAAREVAIFMFFVALAVVMTWPLLAKAPNHIPDIGINDPLMAARFFRAVYEWLSGDASLTNVDIFYPHPNVFGTTDHCVGAALVALPFRLFTDNALLLVNISLFLSFPLTAHGTYLLARTLTASRAAAVVAGTAFSVCLYRFAQLDHVTILQMQWLPYALAFLHRLRDEPTWGVAARFAVFFFLNGISSSNVALYTLPVFPVVAAWTLATVRPETRRRFFVALGVAVLAAGVALLPFFLPYLDANEIYGIKRGVGQQIQWAARIEQFVGAPRWSLLYGGSLSKNMGGESAAFLGATVLTLAALGATWSSKFGAALAGAGTHTGWKGALRAVIGVVITMAIAVALVALVYFALWKGWARAALCVALLAPFVVRLSRRFRGRPAATGQDAKQARGASPAFLYLAIGLGFAALSLGPEVIQRGERLGPGPWTLIMDLPGFGSIRTPSRLFLVTALAAAVLAGIGVNAILSRRLSGRARRLVFAAALTGVSLESWVAPIPMRRIPTLAEAPPVYHWLAARPGRRPVLELPTGLDHRGVVRRFHMYFSNVHKRPTSDDVAGFDLPVVHLVGPDNTRAGNLARELERLKAAAVEFVVMHNAEIPQGERPRYHQAFAAVGATKVAEFGPDEVFLLPDLAKPPVRLSRESATAVIEPPQSGTPVQSPAPLAVSVRFASRAGEAVFERRVRRLSLLATFGSAGQTVTRKRPVYLSPPLFVPSADQVSTVEVPLPEAGGTYETLLELIDDDGAQWATARTVEIVTPRPIAPRQ